MPHRMKIELTERVLSRHPLPIADAVAGLEAAENPHERRDRIVAVFRSVIRTLAAYCLAVRLQYGPGPGDVPAQLPELLRTHGCPLRLNRGVGRSLSAKLCNIFVPFPNRMVERNKFWG